MPNDTTRGPFGGVSEKALNDPELTHCDIHLQAVIALHARFGRNGSGCYLSLDQMAAKARVDKSTVFRSLKKMRDRNHVRRHKPPDSRRFHYFVVYE